VEGKTLTYGQLRAKAESLAATLAQLDQSDDPPLTAVFAYRSVTAFSGVLGALLRGHGYVPLNRTFPADRTRFMFERSKCRALVVDAGSAGQLESVLAAVPDGVCLVLPEVEDVSGLRARWPRHRVCGSRDMVCASAGQFPKAPGGEPLAYLLFTSGSTGVPKGVLLAQRNVLSYLDFVVPRYGITENDRCSQTFDMTFDLSAHDMFVTWEKGACLCCPTQKALIQPGAFIAGSRLTTWFSVPSTAVFMKKLGMLKPNLYPGLRLSLFCGEALPVEVAKGWAEAAPNSMVENIYGPTELTIACTAYRWSAALSPSDCEQGVVPIGEPFHGMEALVVDEQLAEVEPGADGELLMTGPQLSLGYWQDPERTRKSFVPVAGKNGVYYRTGDRVRRPLPGKPLIYLGRMDNQIKILGHRVELGEVEYVIRELSGIDGVVALGWPKTPGGAGGVEVFLESEGACGPQIQEQVARRLPVYMAPRKYRFLPKFPLNSNGKYDRPALLKILEQTS